MQLEVTKYLSAVFLELLCWGFVSTVAVGQRVILYLHAFKMLADN